MNTDFKNGKELLEFCEKEKISISRAMLLRESDQTEKTESSIYTRMETAWNIMKEAALSPISSPGKSIGGLIGGEAKQLNQLFKAEKNICGTAVSRGITYAMAVLEVNASMGLIVAAPTAGSSGIVPGVVLSLKEEHDFSDSQAVDALFNAGAIGYLAMRNATVAGAVGGCQAEVGVASAMAASAAVELMGGSPRQCLYAASTVLMNMLGLVCDPVGGLVEYPCQMRNASGVANAMIAAELALAGIPQLIPFDEMLEAMYTVGKKLPGELRETAMGGCAVTPTGCQYGCKRTLFLKNQISPSLLQIQTNLLQRDLPSVRERQRSPWTGSSFLPFRQPFHRSLRSFSHPAKNQVRETRGQTERCCRICLSLSSSRPASSSSSSIFPSVSLSVSLISPSKPLRAAKGEN